MSRTPTRTRIRIHTTEPRVAGEVVGNRPSQLLRLLHLASPALPIGSFHFSQGLEFAAEAGWVTDESTALEWIGGIAQSSLGTLDLPVLHRLRAAWEKDDHDAVQVWNAFLIACRETEELRAEDRHLGAALLRVLAELDLETAPFPVHAPDSPVGVAHATAFSFAIARWRVDSEAAMQAYAWAWVENQVLAAVKIVPLGQSAAQRMLHALGARIPAWVERALALPDADIGVATALTAVASGRHEAQYTRLFRS
jgi:urease accessory protein